MKRHAPGRITIHHTEEEQVDDAQWAALCKKVSWLAARYRVPPGSVQGHQDYAPTLCPGKDLQRRLGALRAMLEAR